MVICYIILSFLLSISLASIVIPRILLVSYKKKLFDVPNRRKVHKVPIPRLGGVSFFPVLLISLGLSMGVRFLLHCPIIHLDVDILFVRFMFLVVGLTMLYLVGVLDDLVGVSYEYKFLVQIISACLFPLSNLWINSLGGLFGIYDLPAWFGMPFTVFVVVYITNAINLIDGIDGLASGLSCISLGVLGCFCIYFNHFVYAMLAFSMLGVLIPFWCYNVYGRAEHCRKIFMGDAGSLTLGYTVSFIVIHLCMNAEGYAPHGMIMIAFSTLIIPVLDIIRVVMSRIRMGRNPFLPDKNHIHHKFLRTGMRVRWVMASLLSLSLLFVALNVAFVRYVNINITVLFLLDLFLWVVLHLLLNHFIAIKQQKEKTLEFCVNKK